MPIPSRHRTDPAFADSQPRGRSLLEGKIENRSTRLGAYLVTLHLRLATCCLRVIPCRPPTLAPGQTSQPDRPNLDEGRAHTTTPPSDDRPPPVSSRARDLVLIGHPLTKRAWPADPLPGLGRASAERRLSSSWAPHLVRSYTQSAERYIRAI